MRVKLINVYKDYPKYLYEKDKNVTYDEKIPDKVRPYIGVLISFDNKKYVIPMTSYKEKHDKIKSTKSLHIIPKKLGALQIGNEYL